VKWVKVFSVFVVLHIIAWTCAHMYRTAQPTEVLLVVDTSFSLKPQFPVMLRWINEYESSARYEFITVATDKMIIGPLAEISSRDTIFRAAYGRSSVEDFEQYQTHPADKRVLLSDGRFVMQGWETVSF